MEKQHQQHSEAAWRVVNLVLATFFALACFVNKNDADWFIWMPIYCIPSLLCIGAVINPKMIENSLWQSTASMFFFGCLVYGTYEILALSATFMADGFKNPFAYEEGRELGGLCIIASWAGAHIFSSNSNTSEHERSSGLRITTPWMVASLAVVPLAYWGLCYVPGVGDTLSHCAGMRTC